MYLVICALIIRGELEELVGPLQDFNIIDNSGPDHTIGNSHSLLFWKKLNFFNHSEAIYYVAGLSKNWENGGTWRQAIRYDSYLRDGYIKSGHMLLHSTKDNIAIWTEFPVSNDLKIDYLFDGKKSRNNVYCDYGIEI